MSAVPADLQKLLAGAGGSAPPKGPTPSSANASSNTPPPGGAMTTPQPKAGLAQAAVMNVSIVFRLLEQSLPAFGSTSPEGRAILSALKTLTGAFGKDRQKGEELIPAELMQLMATQMPGAGGPPGAAKSLQGAPAGAPALPPQGAGP